MRIENQPYGRLNEILFDQAFTRAPVQAPGDRQHEGSRSGDDRRRPRVLPDLLRAGELHDGDCRRLRRSIRSTDLVNRYLGARAGGRQAPCRATSRRSRFRSEGKARDGRRAVAAAGGRRRVSHHLRRPSRLVSAAHRLEGAVRRPELAHLPQAGVRDGPRADRLRRRQHHRASEPVLRGRRSSIRASRRRRWRRRSSPSSSGSRPKASPSASCSARRTSSRATTSWAASRCRTRRRTWRTPRCIHSDITTADGEFDIFQKISLADVQRVAKTYFTPERRVVLHVMPKGGAQ